MNGLNGLVCKGAEAKSKAGEIICFARTFDVGNKISFTVRFRKNALFIYSKVKTTVYEVKMLGSTVLTGSNPGKAGHILSGFKTRPSDHSKKILPHKLILH